MAKCGFVITQIGNDSAICLNSVTYRRPRVRDERGQYTKWANIEAGAWDAMTRYTRQIAKVYWKHSGFVLKLSLDTPTSAAALLGRLIPVSMVGTLGGKIVVIHRDETAADPEPLILEAKPEEPDGA